jgi:hypothetical protein
LREKTGHSTIETRVETSNNNRLLRLRLIKHRTFEFEFELRTSVGGPGKSFSSL